MLKINLDAARAFAIEAAAQIKAGAIEDVLRHLLSARLPLMFPDNPWWIQAHSIGAEAHVHYIDATGKKRTGFVDSLVGKTAIEYEKNLTNKAIYDEGYRQVEEYCSALMNRGVPGDDVIGILSDTVHWYAFIIRIESETLAGSSYGPANISLVEIESVNLENHSDDNLKRFGLFINRYLGRTGSRQLNSLALTIDLGIESSFCAGHISEIEAAVDEAFASREHYAEMITSLWQSFVARFESDGTKAFNRTAYSHELYIMTLAKLLGANILNGAVVNDDAGELEFVLNGQWFKERGFANLVEYDYFGWLSEPPSIGRLLTIAKEMQNDLAAYDYKNIAAHDFFGSLVAQLADKDRRLLLGQEFTPQWVAHRIVAHAIEFLPATEYPNFVDMCCGSGVFIVETLKQTMERHGITPANCSEETLSALVNCVVGFDIDPLAVLLAKLNWAMTMRDFAPIARAELVIPIYHADSLFATAPLTKTLSEKCETQNIHMAFDGDDIAFPAFLISPPNRRLFDAYIQMSYEVAKARAKADTTEYSQSQAETLIAKLIRDTGVLLDDEKRDAWLDNCVTLIPTLEKLQRDGRNGIWPFLLGNSYRPGLLRGQFNAIVSNPPWMAMSKLANNPYRADLIARAEKYGIKPRGSSHLHVELATVFLLNSVDKYLKDEAYCGVVLPDTLLNGYHHEPFRKQQYRCAEWPIDFKTSEIWVLPTDTFKNKAIVVFGQKINTANPDTLAGRRICYEQEDELLDFHMLRQGQRTAWSSNPNAQCITDGILAGVPFLQGADLMPRTLVFHKATRQPNGKWSLLPIPRQHDELSYLVSLAKQYQNFSLNTQNIDDQFMYKCYISKHILPFIACSPAMAFLPMKRVNGVFSVIDEADIAAYGSANSAAFARIFATTGENATQYFDRLNMRNKLNPQVFNDTSDETRLVLAGAGGGYTCATYIPLTAIDRENTIIDQTLYWYLASNEDEALYLCALLNSRALDGIIADFQPEGAMGRRHVHKLPYAVTPPFNPNDAVHTLVVEKARVLKERLEQELYATEFAQYVSPSKSTLAIRRSKIRDFIRSLQESVDYEDVCRWVYNTR